MSQQIPPIPPSTAGADLIAAINDRIRRINLLPQGSTTVTNTTVIKTGGGVAAAGDVNYGRHALRMGAPISSMPDGALWIETDRNNLIYELQTGFWKYAAGIYQQTQSQLSALGTSLGTNDAGLLVSVTDYLHLLQWTGSAWQWGPGEPGSGMLVLFAVAPGTGWHACDGSTGITYLKATGATGTANLPNTAGTAAYVKAGPSYAAGNTAAVAPTGTNPATGTGFASLGNATAATALTTGSPSTNVAAFIHTHSDAGHTHTVGAPTITLPGDPVSNISAILYFRQ